MSPSEAEAENVGPREEKSAPGEYSVLYRNMRHVLMCAMDSALGSAGVDCGVHECAVGDACFCAAAREVCPAAVATTGAVEP